VTAAKEAAKRGVKCWVELSSGSVYKSEREPRKETDKLKPTVRLAKYKMEAEEELQKIEGCVALVPRSCKQTNWALMAYAG
jgi:dTDP-4-dehydrorhamnose reductase